MASGYGPILCGGSTETCRALCSLEYRGGLRKGDGEGIQALPHGSKGLDIRVSIATVCQRRRLMTTEQYQEIYDRAEEISKMLTGLKRVPVAT